VLTTGHFLPSSNTHSALLMQYMIYIYIYICFDHWVSVGKHVAGIKLLVSRINIRLNLSRFLPLRFQQNILVLWRGRLVRQNTKTQALARAEGYSIMKVLFSCCNLRRSGV
jgi:hypothetical protein